ncbi:hypothetical protein ACLOJK_025488 [Asimina triloba]
MEGMLIKMGIFIMVQALVYLILSGSSNLFSEKPRLGPRRVTRLASMRRILAVLSDFPVGTESSPTSDYLRSRSGKISSIDLSSKDGPALTNQTSEGN